MVTAVCPVTWTSVTSYSLLELVRPLADVAHQLRGGGVGLRALRDDLDDAEVGGAVGGRERHRVDPVELADVAADVAPSRRPGRVVRMMSAVTSSGLL